MFLQRLSQTNFLIVLSINLWLYTFSSITCCFLSSFKHSVDIRGISSEDEVFILAPYLNDCFFKLLFHLTPVLPLITLVLVMFLLIYFSYRPQLGYKKLIFSTSVHDSFYVSNYPSSSSESLSVFHYWLSVSVHLHSST